MKLICIKKNFTNGDKPLEPKYTLVLLYPNMQCKKLNQVLFASLWEELQLKEFI